MGVKCFRMKKFLRCVIVYTYIIKQTRAKPGDPLKKRLPLLHSPMVCGNIFKAPPSLVVKDCAFSSKIDYVLFFFGYFKLRRTSKLLHWFKGYGGFGERGNFT